MQGPASGSAMILDPPVGEIAESPAPAVGGRRGTPCRLCPLRPLPAFRVGLPDEIAFIQSLKVGEQTLPPRSTVLAEGHPAPRMFTLLAGWAFRFKTLADGRRQILNVLLPGDLIGLQAKLFDEAAHGVETLTDVTLCLFARDRVWEIFRAHPQTAFDVTWLAAIEEALVDDTLLSVGRRTSIERMALLLLSLYRRAAGLGLTEPDGALRLPLTQAHLGDALGLSTVHINRTLQAMRRRGLFELTGGVLRGVDTAGLQRLVRVTAGPAHPRPLV